MKGVPLLLMLALLLAGCAGGGVAQAVVPEDAVNLGDVPVSMDMKDVRVTRFHIANAGSGALKLGGFQVKTVEGC